MLQYAQASTSDPRSQSFISDNLLDCYNIITTMPHTCSYLNSSQRSVYRQHHRQYPNDSLLGMLARQVYPNQGRPARIAPLTLTHLELRNSSTPHQNEDEHPSTREIRSSPNNVADILQEALGISAAATNLYQSNAVDDDTSNSSVMDQDDTSPLQQ